MTVSEDVEIVVTMGIDKDDKLVIASYLEMDDLEDFLEDALDIVRSRNLKEGFTSH